MKFNPLVSIIIPVYNGADYMKDAIDSALAQTYKHIEILVINDGSPDGGKTHQIALSYGDRIRYFLKENGGVGSALNLGIKEMKGEYFSWLSHDDLYYPEKVEVQVKAMRTLRRKNQDIVLYSQFELVDENLKLIRKVLRPRVPVRDSFRVLLMESAINGCALLIPRVCVEKCGLFREELKTTQDYELWFRMLKIYDFVHLPDVLVKSRQHGNQGTITMSALHLKENNNLYSWVLDEFNARDLEKKFKTTGPWFYLDIVLNYIWRGFREAAAYALQKMIAAGPPILEIKKINRRIKSLKKKPAPLHEAVLYSMLGDIYKEKAMDCWTGYYQKSLDLLLEKPPKTEAEKYKIASLLKSLGRYDESILWFKKVLKGSRKDNIKGGVCFHLGEIEFFKQNDAEAAVLFMKCLQSIPGHRKAAEYLNLLNAGNKEERLG